MRFQPAETEIQAGPVEHGPGEMKPLRVTLLRKPGQRGPAGVTEAEQLRGLVERLADRIVATFAQNPIIAGAAHIHQLSVSAGNQQAQKRCLQRRVVEVRRLQVALHVVHADGGTSSAQASARPTAAPTSSAPASPGPAVYATPSS